MNMFDLDPRFSVKSGRLFNQQCEMSYLISVTKYLSPQPTAFPLLCSCQQGTRWGWGVHPCAVVTLPGVDIITVFNFF